MNQQELDQALADLKAAVDLTTGAVRTTNDNMDSFSKAVSGKSIGSSLDKIAKDSVKVSQNVGKSLDGLLTATNTFKSKVTEINKALGSINFKGISQSVNGAAESMKGFSKAVKATSGTGSKPTDFSKLTAQTDSLTTSFANLQKTIDRLSSGGGTGGGGGGTGGGGTGGGGGASPPDRPARRLENQDPAIKAARELESSLRGLGRTVVSAGGTLTEFVSTTEQGRKTSLGVIAAMAMTEAAVIGLGKGVLSYSKALLDGERGQQVSAKALGEFTGSITSAAKNIGLAMAMIPGLGIAAKVAGLALAGLAKATEMIAALNERAAKQADDLYKSFTELGKSSANGAKGITGTMENLKKLGMTTAELEKYNKLIGTNTKDMAMFGATTAQGADKFVEVAGTISNPASELGKKFQLLGITAEEQNEHTLKYMSMQARMGTLQGKSTADLVKGASAYIEELDAMARLTGATRKEQEEGREFAMAENKLRAAMLAAQERGDTEEAAHLEKMAKVVGNMAAMGLKSEATGLAHMAAAKGGVTSAESAGMAQAGVSTQAMRGMTAEQATTAAMGGIGKQNKQLAAQEAVGETGMLGSGMAKREDAIARYNKAIAAGKTPEEAAKAGKEEQKAMTSKPDERTSAMVEGVLKQQQVAVEMDQKIFKVLNTANDIHSRFNNAITKMQEEFMKGMDLLGKMKSATGLSTDTIQTIMSAVLGIATPMLMAWAGKNLLSKSKAADIGKTVLEKTSSTVGDLAGGAAPVESKGGRKGGKAGGKSKVPSMAGGDGGSTFGKSVGDFGEGLGKFIGSVGEGGGKAIEAILRGLSAGLVAFANPMVVGGAIAIGLAITAIGAGIAGATWLMGKALPTLAEGLKAFGDIDGKNLVQVGLGVGALGAGLAVFGAGGVAASFGAAASGVVDGLVGFFGGKTPFDKIVEFSKLDIDGKKVKTNAEALQAFGLALAAMGAGGAVNGLGTIASALGDGIAGFFGVKTPYDKMIEFGQLNFNVKKVKENSEAMAAFGNAMSSLTGGASATLTGALADGVAGFFGVKTPYDKMVAFSELNFNAKKVKENAEAMAAFGNAMGALSGGASATLTGALADGVAGFLGVKLPYDKFVEFSKLTINPSRVKGNSEAFIAFNNAMSTVKGTGGATLTSAIGDAVANFFGTKLPMDKFVEFSKLIIDGEKVKVNAEAFTAFSNAMGTFGSSGALTGLGTAVSAIGDSIANFFGAELPFGKFVNFSKLDIDGVKTKSNAEAFTAFSAAMGTYGMGGTLSGLGTAVAAIGDAIGKFFGGQPPFKKFEDFSKLDIDGKKVKLNAEAFGMFAEAMSKFGAGGAMAGLGTAVAAVGDWVAKLLGQDGPIKKFKEFSELKIDSDKTKTNAEAFKAFAEGMSLAGKASSVSGTGNIIETINKVFENKVPLQKFIEFSKLQIDGDKVGKNAEAFRKFAEAMGMSGGAGGATVKGGAAGAAPAAGGGAGGAAGAAAPAAGTPTAKGMSVTPSKAGAPIAGTTDTLKDAGLIVKKGDVQKEGAELDPTLIEIAKQIQGAVPGFKQFTGFNDQFHNEKSPKSLHAKGKAFDFTVEKPPSREEGQQIVKMMQSLGINYAIDEYNNPSSKATAGHFHGQLQAKEGGLFDGPDSGYNVTMHGSEAVLPMTKGKQQLSGAGLKDLTASMSNSDFSAKISEMTSAIVSTLQTTSGSNNNGAPKEMIESLNARLDEMIDLLRKSHNTQEQHLSVVNA